MYSLGLQNLWHGIYLPNLAALTDVVIACAKIKPSQSLDKFTGTLCLVILTFHWTWFGRTRVHRQVWKRIAFLMVSNTCVQLSDVCFLVGFVSFGVFNHLMKYEHNYCLRAWPWRFKQKRVSCVTIGIWIHGTTFPAGEWILRGIYLPQCGRSCSIQTMNFFDGEAATMLVGYRRDKIAILANYHQKEITASNWH